MGKYLGVKLIEAEPMNLVDAEELLQRKIKPGDEPGYLVKYPDGYASWSPKDTFEKAYLKVGDNNTIVETNVHDFVKEIEFQQWGDKTTIAVATLANGFILTESSSCVDAENFNMDIGSRICRERIHNRVWELLGFLLQTGVKGIK